MEIIEMHSIKPFRGTDLGIIRLKNLSYPDKMKITIDGKEFKPIGFDTYGHPVMSKETFTYYKALKAIRERQGESLSAQVEYEKKPFCIRREIFDSLDAIEDIVDNEEEDKEEENFKLFKKILVYRKRAAFAGYTLNTFVVDRYVLTSNGHIYMCYHNGIKPFDEKEYESRGMKKPTERNVLMGEEVFDLKQGEEVHIPGGEDVCAICGQRFTLNDVKEFNVVEDNNCRKIHRECFCNSKEAIEYQIASHIIDSVYRDTPPSEVIREYDVENSETKVWYKYHTVQGDLALRFKKKVIVIKWFGNFKPFNMSLFDDEDVTKVKGDDCKIIHAWSQDDAERYLRMVKKF